MSTLFTHKEGIYYIEHAKIIVSDCHLAYISQNKLISQYFSIPINNICVLLLGPGTSLTQQAAKMLAEQMILTVFTGGDGLPILYASLNEYRSPEFSQKFFIKWQDENTRLDMAKQIQKKRADFNLICLETYMDIYQINQNFIEKISNAKNHAELLGYEGNYVKTLYKEMSINTNIYFAKRDHKSNDNLNKNITNGNYMGYSLSSLALWILGIPYSLAIMHGKTRRGGLVFDIADIVKCGIVLPNAFLSAKDGLSNTDFKKKCIKDYEKYKSLEYMIRSIQDII